MATKTYEFRDDQSGEIIRFEGPDDATPDEIAEVLDQMAGSAPQPSTPRERTPQVAITPQQPQAPATPRGVPGQAAETSTQLGMDTWGQAERPDPLSEADLVEYVRMTQDANVPSSDIANWLAQRGAVFGPQAEEQLRVYREAIARGEPVSSFVDYNSAGNQILGPEHVTVDPNINNEGWLSNLGAAVSEGSFTNLMRAPSQWIADLTDQQIAGVTKDDLRSQFPELDDASIERLHDSLIGEQTRRLRQDATAQVDMRHVDPATRIVGNIVGGISPADVVPLGRGLTFGARLAEGAAANVAADAILQSTDMAYGAQGDYNFGQTFQAGVEGAALQGVFEGAARGVRAGANAVSGRLDARRAATAQRAADAAPPLVSVPDANPRTNARRTQMVQTVQTIADRINHQVGSWENAPAFEVHPNFNDIPNLPRTEQRNVGFYDAETGAVHINSDAVLRIARDRNVTPEAVVDAVTFHEALGHYGMAQHFREDLDATLDYFYDNGTTAFRASVDQWMTRNPGGYRGDPLRRTRATEEVLANMSNNGRLPRRFIDRVTNAVKASLRRMGVDIKVSEREVRTIMGMAHDAVINGKRHDVRGNGFRWQSENDNVINLGEKRQERELKAFKQELDGTIRQQSEALADRVRILRSKGEMPFDVGTRFTTTKSRELNQGPWEVTGYHVDPRDPDRYGYKVRRDGEENIMLVSDPRADVRMKENNPLWDRQANVAEWQSLTGPRRFATADDLFPENDYTKTEKTEVDIALKTLNDMTADYTPTVVSNAEVQGMARSMGLTSGHIARLKGLEPGEIARKLVQYDILMQQTSERLAEMNAEIINNRDYSRKEEYLKTILQAQHITAVLFNSQGEVGRALAIIRTLENSRKKLEDFNEVLQGINGNNISAFASDDVMFRFARDLQTHLDSGNVAGGAAMQRQVLNPYWWQYVLTFRHAAMLSGLATHAKNFTDSAIMITRLIEEKAGAWAIGKARSLVNADADRVTSAEVAAHTYGIVQALFDHETYQRSFKAFREGYGNHQYGAKIEMQDARIPVVSKVNDALYASDMFFRAFHDNSNLYSLGVREAQKQGFTGMNAITEGAAIARNPDKKMVDAARQMTDEALLVDTPSGLTEALEVTKAIRPGMSGGRQALSFTMNILLPFLRVTDRLVFQALRRSPLALLDKNTRNAIKAGGPERDIAISRALMGSAIMAYYWYSSDPEAVASQEEGAVQGQPQDYRKEQALQGGGYRANSVIKDGQNVDATAINLSWIPWNTQNNIASSIATLHDRYDAGGITAAMRGLLHILGQQSYVENLGPYVELITDEDANVSDVGAGLASQFVPAAVRQVNQQFVDPIQRNARGDGSALDKISGRVMSAVPGLSDNLPARHSVYGDEMPHGRSTFGMNNATPIMQDAVSRELQKVERSTRDVVVRGAPKYFQHNNQQIDMTATQQEQWQQIQGAYIREQMGIEVRDPAWRQLSMEDKRAIVEEIYDEAREVAKEQMLQELGLE